MDKDMDNEEKQFQELLADKRHRELNTSMLEVVSAIHTSNHKSMDMVAAIEKLPVVLQVFSESLKKLEECKTDIPKDDDSKSEESINKLGQAIITSLCEVRDLLIVYNKPKEYEFKIDRSSYSGLIEKVTATIKN